MLVQYHLHVRTLVVNGVLPEDEAGEFLKQRKAYEKQYLKKIEEEFHDKQLIFVTFFSHAIINIEQLRKFANYLA